MFFHFCQFSFSQPPPLSTRPPVTGCKILQNITGSVVVNETNDTNLAFERVVPGVYLFTVLAVNVLGDGDEPYDIIVTGK